MGISPSSYIQVPLLSNATSTRSFLRPKRFSTVDILFLLFRTVFALGKMLVEIKSKFSAKIFGLKMSLRAENSAWWKTAFIICSLGKEPVKITKEASRDKFQMRF